MTAKPKSARKASEPETPAIEMPPTSSVPNVPTAPAPTPKRRVTPWSEIRSTYEESALPVSVIAKAYAVRERAVYERAAKEGWVSRRNQVAERPLDRSILVGRLFHAVERQIAEIERRFVDMAGTGGDERDARTLAALARTIELLIGLERQARPDMSDAPEADIDAIRRDLARRIANLQGAGTD